MGTNETRYGFMDEGWATALNTYGVEDVGVEGQDSYSKCSRQQLASILTSNRYSHYYSANDMYGIGWATMSMEKRPLATSP
jgi:hypothetical protein